jgi:hypothetical protein
MNERHRLPETAANLPVKWKTTGRRSTSASPQISRRPNSPKPILRRSPRSPRSPRAKTRLKRRPGSPRNASWEGGQLLRRQRRMAGPATGPKAALFKVRRLFVLFSWSRRTSVYTLTRIYIYVYICVCVCVCVCVCARVCVSLAPEPWHRSNAFSFFSPQPPNQDGHPVC